MTKLTTEILTYFLIVPTSYSFDADSFPTYACICFVLFLQSRIDTMLSEMEKNNWSKFLEYLQCSHLKFDAWIGQMQMWSSSETLSSHWCSPFAWPHANVGEKSTLPSQGFTMCQLDHLHEIPKWRNFVLFPKALIFIMDEGALECKRKVCI